jgi:hypothetical protein
MVFLLGVYGRFLEKAMVCEQVMIEEFLYVIIENTNIHSSLFYRGIIYANTQQYQSNMPI